MYFRTNSLWTCWISHTLTNSAINFIHIRTDEGIDSGITIRMAVYVVAMLFSVWSIKYFTDLFKTPKVKAWS
ncbi:MAG: hypothetical protein ACM3TR_14500 [Caulobacteraceae bacterium]